MNLRDNAWPDCDATLIRRVEHALDVVRTYLLECATQDEWTKQSTAQLAEIVSACVVRIRDQDEAQRLRGDGRLSRHVLRQAVRFINGHLDAKLKWHDIAGEVGMEPFAFARGFKSTTGLTVRQYVIRCRVHRAVHLLGNGHFGLSEIALEVGFSCQSHMTTLFRKHVGMTPGAFRTCLRRREPRSVTCEISPQIGRHLPAEPPRVPSNRLGMRVGTHAVTEA